MNDLKISPYQGKRVGFSRNGYKGYGIVIGEEGSQTAVAVIGSPTSPQTYAWFARSELTIYEYRIPKEELV